MINLVKRDLREEAVVLHQILPGIPVSPEEALEGFRAMESFPEMGAHSLQEERTHSLHLARGEGLVEVHSIQQIQTRSLSEYLRNTGRVTGSSKSAQTDLWPLRRNGRDGWNGRNGWNGRCEKPGIFVI